MRKLVAILVVFPLVGLVGMAGASAGTIIGSLHDLTIRTTTTSDVCVFCHTPHNTADPATFPVPLWNRQASTVTFDMYSSVTLDMVIATEPQGVSAACLSCHDGVTAYDALVNKPGGLILNEVMTGPRAVGAGGDLTNDHPVSVTYSVGTGPGQDPAFHAAVNGKVNGLPLFREPGATGVGNQVECASCHNPHEPDFGKFLRISNVDSALCTTCHIK